MSVGVVGGSCDALCFKGTCNRNVCLRDLVKNISMCVWPVFQDKQKSISYSPIYCLCLFLLLWNMSTLNSRGRHMHKAFQDRG